MGLYENLKSIKENAEIENANKQKESQYQNELKKYNDILNDTSENDKNGSIRKKLGKKLIFENEPNATLTTYGNHIKFIDSVRKIDGIYVPSTVSSDNLDNNSILKTSHKDHFLYLKENESIIAEYTNLHNSHFNGNSISKVRYKYTLEENSNEDKSIIISSLADPTVTVYIHDKSLYNKNTNFKIKLDVSFYDEKGEEIIPNEKDYALLTFSSINSKSGRGEYVSDFSGEFEYINGSAITEKNGKAMNYSNKDISDYAIEQGSQDGLWDKSNSKYAYVGSIVGKATNKISLSIGNDSKAYWFALNTKLQIKNIPSYPKKPNLAPLKPIEKIPCKQPECYEGCHECCCDSIDLNNKMEDNLLKVDFKIDKMFNQICVFKTANCFNRTLLVSQYAYKLWCLMNDIMLLLAYFLIKKGSKPKTTTETSSNKQIIKYSSETITDDDLEWDKTVVSQKGEDGYIVNTTTKTYQDGVLTNEETKETERKEPIKEIIKKGTKKTDTIILTITDNDQNIPYYSFKISGKVGDKFNLKNYVKDKLNSDGSITYHGSKYTNPFNLMEDTYRIDNISDTSEYFYRKRS